MRTGLRFDSSTKQPTSDYNLPLVYHNNYHTVEAKMMTRIFIMIQCSTPVTSLQWQTISSINLIENFMNIFIWDPYFSTLLSQKHAIKLRGIILAGV